tara:strand:- start:1493 stop:2899 length:1407 start_codon:yes stop_codon:yes gene_type:complete
MLSDTLRQALINIPYLVAAFLFILGLKYLAHPRTAVRGNFLSAMAMLIAVVFTLFDQNILPVHMIAIGLGVGGAIGAFLAIRVAMTEMPELVALFNGFGGLSSVLVASAAYVGADPEQVNLQLSVATIVSALIGAVTFWGSLIAYLKLRGQVVPSGAVTSPILKILNGLFALSILGLAVVFVANPGMEMYFWAVIGVACLMGITLVIPIGGADMPVVIALLNSYSGLAACAAGFVLNNNLLIIAGSLVGASGLILTQIMCKAMNRSLANVLFGGLGAEESGPAMDADEVYAGKVTSASADEAAMIFDSVQRVVIVPGYGMAVAQAQHVVKQFTALLQDRGTEVLYAIHPVAGRMPGHMNVLLAEADVPYEQLIEMDDINPTFPQTDVALVIGANDVVNPVAKTDPGSPIAGMPILDVDQAKTVMVIKRSLSPGFAGIPNPLFAADNTMMLFGDGKQIVVDLVEAMKEL